MEDPKGKKEKDRKFEMSPDPRKTYSVMAEESGAPPVAPVTANTPVAMMGVSHMLLKDVQKSRTQGHGSLEP